jgi:hypothetical protein
LKRRIGERRKRRKKKTWLREKRVFWVPMAGTEEGDEES